MLLCDRKRVHPILGFEYFIALHAKKFRAGPPDRWLIFYQQKSLGPSRASRFRLEFVSCRWTP